MPTLRMPTLAGVSISATGSSRIMTARNGTIVSYSGLLKLNGRVVLAPEQILTKWSEQGEKALREADRTEHTDPKAHAYAKGICGAHATAVQLLTAWVSGPFGKAGLPLGDIVASIKVARASIFEQMPADTNDLGRLSITAATSTLLQLADELTGTAAYTWDVPR